MKNLFTVKYWFTVNPEPLTRLGFSTLLGFVILIFVLGLISFILKSRGGLYKKVLNNLYDFSAANLFIGLIFLFFNYENVPFFTARFWLGFWAIGLGVWLFFILKKLKEVPKKRKMIEAEQEKKKYLP